MMWKNLIFKFLCDNKRKSQQKIKEFHFIIYRNDI